MDNALRLQNGDMIEVHKVNQFLFEKNAWTIDKVVLKDPSVAGSQGDKYVPANRDRLETWRRCGPVTRMQGSQGRNQEISAPAVGFRAIIPFWRPDLLVLNPLIFSVVFHAIFKYGHLRIKSQSCYSASPWIRLFVIFLLNRFEIK